MIWSECKNYFRPTLVLFCVWSINSMGLPLLSVRPYFDPIPRIQQLIDRANSNYEKDPGNFKGQLLKVVKDLAVPQPDGPISDDYLNFVRRFIGADLGFTIDDAHFGLQVRERSVLVSLGFIGTESGRKFLLSLNLEEYRAFNNHLLAAMDRLEGLSADGRHVQPASEKYAMDLNLDWLTFLMTYWLKTQDSNIVLRFRKAIPTLRVALDSQGNLLKASTEANFLREQTFDQRFKSLKEYIVYSLNALLHSDENIRTMTGQELSGIQAIARVYSINVAALEARIVKVHSPASYCDEQLKHGDSVGKIE